jgi:uncharacterized protein (DUF427 family)
MPDNITVTPVEGTWVVRADGAVLGESTRAVELREDGHDPVIYFPREDIAMAFLEASSKVTRCPHKGDAGYYSIVTEGMTLPDAVWTYVEPKTDLPEIAGHLAFDPRQVTVEQV